MIKTLEFVRNIIYSNDCGIFLKKNFILVARYSTYFKGSTFQVQNHFPDYTTFPERRDFVYITLIYSSQYIPKLTSL